MVEKLKKPNYQLRLERKNRGWTQARLAEAIGADTTMVSRWECGERSPDISYQEKLCFLFNKNATELGFVDVTTLLQPSHISTEANTNLLALPISEIQQIISTEMSVPDNATKLGFMLAQMIILIQEWYGMARFCHRLQAQLDNKIKEFDTLKTENSLDIYTLSRRAFLSALATLPVALMTSHKQTYKFNLDLEEFLPQCAASITACWHLSGSNHLNGISPIIDSYLPTLITVMKNVPSYREAVADLIAQCYFLKTILAWHLEGLHNAEIYCKQAMQYSNTAKNTNLHLTALNQHALISYYAKQFQKAHEKSEEAYTILQRQSQSHEPILSIVQGRVYMYLAAIQAQQLRGKAHQTLELAQEAFASQPATEAVPIYADCGNAPLTLWRGLTYYHLSLRNPTYAKQALASLSIFGQLEPDTTIPERFRLECLNNRILAAIQCDEMEEAITSLEAGKVGARALKSKQRNIEVEYAYQIMLNRWTTEDRVRELKTY